MLLNFNSLQYSFFPVSRFLHQHTCLIPVNSVLVFPCMDRYTILGVLSLHRRLVLHQSFLQAPSCFTNVRTIVVHTRDFIDDSFLQQRIPGVINLHKGFPEGASGLKHSFYANLYANPLYVFRCVPHIWEVEQRWFLSGCGVILS